MLQEEPIENSDPYTGEPSYKDDRDITAIVKVITQGEAFDELRRTKAWPYLIEFFESEIKGLTDCLKVEQDINKIRVVQAEIRVLESLPLLVEKVFVDMEEAKRMVREFLINQEAVS